jgi:hypothetical protein
MFDQTKKPRSCLAKAAAILAAIFGISLGLCGVNFFALVNKSGDNDFLMFTAYAETAAIGASALGLLAIGFIAIFRVIAKALSSERDKN